MRRLLLRIPGQNSPEQIGELIAVEYALLDESTPAAMRRSAQLRARAAALRDAQASGPDWVAVSRLPAGSYLELRATVGQPS